MAPGTKRILADQYNAPKTSVKMYTDVSTINPQTIQWSVSQYNNTGAWVASGSRCYVAPRLPHCAAPCSCVCMQGAQHRGFVAYQARASPIRPAALQYV